jgi:hypothetical protein
MPHCLKTGTQTASTTSRKITFSMTTAMASPTHTTRIHIINSFGMTTTTTASMTRTKFSSQIRMAMATAMNVTLTPKIKLGGMTTTTMASMTNSKPRLIEMVTASLTPSTLCLMISTMMD